MDVWEGWCRYHAAMKELVGEEALTGNRRIEMEKRLYRSRKESMIGGVCGGLAEYLGVDPTLVRILFVLAVLTGMTLLVYPVLWIVMPLRPAEEQS